MPRSFQPFPRKAFTLVELLIVIGMVALLIGILMPILSKSRRQAAQVACLSNLRQLGIALLTYANQDRGYFPAAGSELTMRDEDWVHWQPGRDISNSRLLKYVGGNLDVLKCPLGIPERTASAGPPYPFSYTVNMLFTGLTTTSGTPRWNSPPCKLERVVHSSQKMLAVEEDTSVISDGAWYSTTGKYWRAWAIPYVSVRHDGAGREYSRREDGPAYHGRGNVVFADGHGEFLDRRKAYQAFFCIPDYDGPVPPGFE